MRPCISREGNDLAPLWHLVDWLSRDLSLSGQSLALPRLFPTMLPRHAALNDPSPSVTPVSPWRPRETHKGYKLLGIAKELFLNVQKHFNIWGLLVNSYPAPPPQWELYNLWRKQKREKDRERQRTG